MEEETYDDPKQILVILNSLGVVGVTALELKAFMKELKVYKKVKRKMCQQSKDKTKMKILQKQDEAEIIFQIHDSKQKSIDKILKKQEQEFISRQTSMEKQLKRQEQDFTPKQNRIKTAQNCTKVYTNNNQFIESNNKENNMENRIVTSIENLKCSRNKSPCKKASTNQSQQQIKKNEIQSVRKCGSVKKILVEAASSKSKESDIPYSCRRNNNSESCSKSKSFIRTQITCTESKSSLSSKKSSTDPVTLYRKYKEFWDHLSIPGEENHAKLRWAIREKMLGRCPVPKPIIPHKIPLQRSTSLRKK